MTETDPAAPNGGKDTRIYRRLELAAVALLGTGTVFYHVSEEWSWVASWRQIGPVPAWSRS